ncbi:hypothetical protein OG762_42495 [Streptomyces sp. NBC_01136]|uniref:hypothetical protein n=1 Tax=unclassified Streptomyces TaxID=2593676 RepID=UPI00324B81D0|nr:hypothetical protein OG762_42495 [Streptomyces sp. NBC_01136]
MYRSREELYQRIHPHRRADPTTAVRQSARFSEPADTDPAEPLPTFAEKQERKTTALAAGAPFTPFTLIGIDRCRLKVVESALQTTGRS